MPCTVIETTNLFRLVHVFDVLAAVLFAVSGALVASRKGMDDVGSLGLPSFPGAGGGPALDLGAPALVASVMGVVTGSLGGIIRDTLGHVRWVILRHEIYVTASVLGACTFIALNALGPGRLSAMIAGFLVTFGIRGLAIKYGWSLPIFRETATRER